MLKAACLTAVVLLALLLLALFALPVSGWAVLVILHGDAGGFGMGETGQSHRHKSEAILVVDAADAAGSGLVRCHSSLWTAAIAAFAGVCRVCPVVAGMVPTWLITGWKVRQPQLMMLTGWAVLVPTGLAMMDLRAISPWLLLFVMGLVWVADISAYFAGRRFGKNKLAPGISPGKTWEGVAGAMLGVSLYVVLVWGFSPDFDRREVLPILLLASWWWVGLAVIGDLFESAIKRQAGAKDSGTLLPGHGGLLDRIDALTSTLPLAALVILMQRLAGEAVKREDKTVSHG